MEMSDTELLKRLLESDQLTDPQHDAFQGMLVRLKAGRMEKLTDHQRKWVMDVYDKLDLVSSEGAQNLISSGKYVPTKEERVKKFPWEMMPRPLKPPGKK